MLKLYFILVEKFNFDLTLLIDIPIWILALKLKDILEYLSQNPSENLIFFYAQNTEKAYFDKFPGENSKFFNDFGH